MASRWELQKQAVLATAQEMARLGLVTGASGNVSLRLGHNGARELLAITPSQRPYQTLSRDDIVVIDLEGQPVEGELPPSSETLLHAAIFRKRRDVAAVVHTHSVYASACAVAGLEVPPLLDELVVAVGGPVPLAEYAFPGTAALAEQACRALGERNAVLLQNHGLVGVGRDLSRALEVCTLVERVAQVYVVTLLLGRVNPLPPEMVRTEQDLFRIRRQAEGGPL